MYCRCITVKGRSLSLNGQYQRRELQFRIVFYGFLSQRHVSSPRSTSKYLLAISSGHICRDRFQVGVSQRSERSWHGHETCNSFSSATNLERALRSERVQRVIGAVSSSCNRKGSESRDILGRLAGGQK